jgi:hypothetical protein
MAVKPLTHPASRTTRPAAPTITRRRRNPPATSDTQLDWRVSPETM